MNLWTYFQGILEQVNHTSCVLVTPDKQDSQPCEHV